MGKDFYEPQGIDPQVCCLSLTRHFACHNGAVRFAPPRQVLGPCCMGWRCCSWGWGWGAVLLCCRLRWRGCLLPSWCPADWLISQLMLWVCVCFLCSMQVTVEKVIAFLLRKKVPRQTEGGWVAALGTRCGPWPVFASGLAGWLACRLASVPTDPPHPTPPAGMLLNSQFSSNYFSISQVEQNFDDFADYFKGEQGAGWGRVASCLLCSG